MADLTIKNVPEAVHKALKKAAERRGRSLNSHVIQLLKETLAEQRRYERMRRSEAKLLRIRKSLPQFEDSTLLIREMRDQD